MPFFPLECIYCGDTRSAAWQMKRHYQREHGESSDDAYASTGDSIAAQRQLRNSLSERGYTRKNHWNGKRWTDKIVKQG